MPELGAASSCNPGNISKYSDNLKTEISSLHSAQYSSTLYQMLLLVTHKTQDPLILNKVSLRSSLAKVAEVSILVWRRGDSPKLFLECRVEGRKFRRIKFGFLQADYCPRISTSDFCILDFVCFNNSNRLVFPFVILFLFQSIGLD